MIETFLAALLWAKIKKYRLKPVFTSWVLYPAILLIVLSLYFEIMIFRGDYRCIKYSGVLHVLLIITFLIPAFTYRLYLPSYIGLGCVISGSLLNKIAIHYNHGKMPVFPTLSYLTGYVKRDSFRILSNDIHILGNEKANLFFLTDFIDFGYCIMSIGDILIRIFPLIIVYYTVKSLNGKEPAQKEDIPGST